MRDKFAEKELSEVPIDVVASTPSVLTAFGMTDAEWSAWQDQARSAPLAEKAEDE